MTELTKRPQPREHQSPLSLLNRDWEHLMDRLMNGSGEATGWGSYPVDVREDDQVLHIEAELPGFKKEQINVSLDQGVLTIRAERQPESEEGQTHLHERRFTRVIRSLTLPASIDPATVEARLEQGVLHLTLPKTEDTKARRIPVR